jgi:hypothetical protein
VTVSATEPELREALDRVSSMLDADGFALEVKVDAGHLDATVVATTAACAECLVPKELLGSMILDKLAGAGIVLAIADLVLTYPADITH